MLLLLFAQGALSQHDSHDGWSEAEYLKKKRLRKSPRQRQESEIEAALARALEPPQKRKKVQVGETWFAEPIAIPPALNVPVFDPVLAALHGDIARITDELARVKELALHEDGDIELLLLTI